MNVSSGTGGYQISVREQTIERRFRPGEVCLTLEFRVPGWPALHSHEYYEIMYVDRGEGKHIIDSDIHDIVPGSVFFIKPGIAHKLMMRPSTDVHFFNIEFLPSMLTGGPKPEEYQPISLSEIGVASERVGRGPMIVGMVFTGRSAGEVSSAFSALVEENRERRPYWGQLIIPRLQIVLAAMVRASAEGNIRSLLVGGIPEKLITSLSFIQDHFTRDIQVNDVCEASRISRSSLFRLFRNHLGIGVVDHVLDLRITKSLVLLRSGLTVADTAYRCGFRDPAYFGRAFRKAIGMSPANYRKSQTAYTALYPL